MNQSNEPELTCNRWLAKILLDDGKGVFVHINRGSPISSREAMTVARKTAKFGKIENLLPVGPCLPGPEEENL